MDRRINLVLAASLLFATAFTPGPKIDLGDAALSLSPYWGSTITQWAELISEYAGQQGLDSDLVAAIIYEESQGHPQRISVVGAVGLMQLMPYETGFTWRPTTQELLSPTVNVQWGTRTFSQIVRQAEGNVKNALAAYNGGWDQIELRAPQHYSRLVVDHYARSIAMRAGYDGRALKAWKLVFNVRTSYGVQRIDVASSDGALEVGANFDLSKLPASTPHATAYSMIDHEGVAWMVEAWVIVEPIEGLSPNPARGVY
jgi:hypothetical protein